MSAEALEHCLSRLAAYLEGEDVEDLVVNKPGRVMVRRRSSWSTHEDAKLDMQFFHRLAFLLATSTSQEVCAARPLLSAGLPDGSRVQIVMPPACPHTMFGLTIRRASTAAPSLATLCGAVESSAQEDEEPSEAALTQPLGLCPLPHATPQGGLPLDVSLSASHDERSGTRAAWEKSRSLLTPNELAEQLTWAVQNKWNILVCGGTSSGKTTMLRSLIRLIPRDERIISIEDVPEIDCPHENYFSMLASKGGQGVGQVTISGLLEASLRMRPDRILLGEIRSEEACDFLEALNTGHPGCLSTIHADSVQTVFDRLIFLVRRKPAFSALPHQALLAYVQSSIDLVVHMGRGRDGRRCVVDTWKREGIACDYSRA